MIITCPDKYWNIFAQISTLGEEEQRCEKQYLSSVQSVVPLQTTRRPSRHLLCQCLRFWGHLTIVFGACDVDNKAVNRKPSLIPINKLMNIFFWLMPYFQLTQLQCLKIFPFLYLFISVWKRAKSVSGAPQYMFLLICGQPSLVGSQVRSSNT